jgi:hypothetical protein
MKEGLFSQSWPIHALIEPESRILELELEGIEYDVAYKLEKKKCFKLMTLVSPFFGPDGCKAPASAQGKLVDAACDALRKLGGHVVLPYGAMVVHDAYPAGARAVHFGTYEIDLHQDVDSLLARMHPKHRNVVRRAAKAGVEIVDLKSDPISAYGIYRDSQARTGNQAVKESAFLALLGRLGENVLVKAARYAGEYQGVAVVPWSLYAGYYLWGGSVDTPETGSMNLLQWDIMQDLKRRQADHYDLVGARLNPPPGSKLEGIQRFKERFGGVARMGYLWRKDLVPGAYALYSAYRALAAFARGRRASKGVIDEECARGNRADA